MVFEFAITVDGVAMPVVTIDSDVTGMTADDAILFLDGMLRGAAVFAGGSAVVEGVARNATNGERFHSYDISYCGDRDHADVEREAGR